MPGICTPLFRAVGAQGSVRSVGRPLSHPDTGLADGHDLSRATEAGLTGRHITRLWSSDDCLHRLDCRRRKFGIPDMLTLPDPWTEECLETDLEVVYCKFIIMKFMTSY